MTGRRKAAAYNARQPSTPSTMSQIEALADRVERLLLRHDELQRTNGLLRQQVETITHDRDALRARLNAARARIDALLERLPADPEHAAKQAQSDAGPR